MSLSMTQVRLTRRERAERTRDDLLEGARGVFAEKGFHGASVEEIAAAAGYSTGAIYSRFAGKHALFLAVLDEHTERRRELFDAAARDAVDVEGAVRAIA